MLAGYKISNRQERGVIKSMKLQYGSLSNYRRALNRFAKYNPDLIRPKRLKRCEHGHRIAGKWKVNDTLKDKKMYRGYSIESDGRWYSSIYNDGTMSCDPFRCSRAWRFYRKIGRHIVEMRWNHETGLHVVYRKNG